MLTHAVWPLLTLEVSFMSSTRHPPSPCPLPFLLPPPTLQVALPVWEKTREGDTHRGWAFAPPDTPPEGDPEFGCHPDPINRARFVRDLYDKGAVGVMSKFSVPVSRRLLWPRLEAESERGLNGTHLAGSNASLRVSQGQAVVPCTARVKAFHLLSYPPASLPASLPACLPACLPASLPPYLPSFRPSFLPFCLLDCRPTFLVCKLADVFCWLACLTVIAQLPASASSSLCGAGISRRLKMSLPLSAAQVLWDTKTSRIVNNESAQIMRMLNSEFNAFAKNPDLDLTPAALMPAIEEVNGWVLPTINSGVYKCGNATTQAAYDEVREGKRKVHKSLVYLMLGSTAVPAGCDTPARGQQPPASTAARLSGLCFIGTYLLINEHALCEHNMRW